jgi:glycosyltransferase involved in cell wall biosynthesis
LNAARYIRETLDSVASQGGGVEHIVVDAGSSDGTLDILRQAGGSIRLVTVHGLRQAAAVNRGWRLAAGEILGWLNADDVYLPGAIDQAVGHLAQHPDADGVYGDCDYVDAEGALLRRYPAAAFDLRRMVTTVDNPVPQPATFLRRTLLETVGGLDESLDYAMDFEYWLRLGVRGGFLGYLSTPLARLRLHDAAKSVRGLDAMGEEILRVYEGLFGRPDLPVGLRRQRRRALGRA